MAVFLGIEHAEALARKVSQDMEHEIARARERDRKMAESFAAEWKGVWLEPDNGYAHRDRVRKRTAFKHGVQFRAARKVMR